jgi:hypothetical protein
MNHYWCSLRLWRTFIYCYSARSRELKSPVVELGSVIWDAWDPDVCVDVSEPDDRLSDIRSPL